MILKQNFLFFKSVRVLHQSEDLDKLILENKDNYLTIISYTDLGLEKKGFDLVHKKIANIYLDKPITEILSTFARRTYQDIQKTYSIPELKIVIDDSNFSDTYNLYREFEIAQGRKPWKASSFKGTKLYNAYYGGKLIASVPCYDIFPHLQVRAIFSKRLTVDDREMQKIVGFATRRLIYEICVYGKERNYTFVGLGSVNFSTPQKANVAQFKMFFGTRVEDEYTYIYKSKKFIFLNNIFQRIKRIL